MSSVDERLYRIACAFPALREKGVEAGRIPGISPVGFSDAVLSDYLYRGGGGRLSSGEFLILEALLNLCDPTRYDRFNLGRALQILDAGNLGALLGGIRHTYAGECDG